jgi:hypothetical protein
MKPTRDHAAIREWAKRHNAVPAEIKPLKFDSEPSILYFLIGNARSGTPEIRPISWEDFFARFDLLNLAMVWDGDEPTFELLKIENASGSFAQ